ncbi:hypothetical protein K6119_09460 [Paracrocinitomix mangrovi]|uniref:hypothetical protein n=1 Tax=Paracrocinitomix mangrovi TaxID=2862509 RepID=UPI001C8D92B9|nr:hypothetical protein [Paracrocinitomix mangrovi]UKN03717.1 hypothetical protein K6119_09460 [Paracrocinitomix mangrovi]
MNETIRKIGLAFTVSTLGYILWCMIMIIESVMYRGTPPFYVFILFAIYIIPICTFTLLIIGNSALKNVGKNHPCIIKAILIISISSMPITIILSLMDAHPDILFLLPTIGVIATSILTHQLFLFKLEEPK